MALVLVQMSYFKTSVEIPIRREMAVVCVLNSIFNGSFH